MSDITNPVLPYFRCVTLVQVLPDDAIKPFPAGELYTHLCQSTDSTGAIVMYHHPALALLSNPVIHRRVSESLPGVPRCDYLIGGGFCRNYDYDCSPETLRPLFMAHGGKVEPPAEFWQILIHLLAEELKHPLEIMMIEPSDPASE